MKYLPLEIKGEKIFAGFVPRFGAALIDTCVVLPILLLFTFLRGVNYHVGMVFVVASGVSFAVYNIVFHALFGGTAGKLAVGIRVTTIDGSKIGWGNAIRRSLVDLFFALLIVGFELWVLFNVSPKQFYALSFVERPFIDSKVTPLWIYVVQRLQTLWIISELVVLLTNKRKRAIHDLIGGTVVIAKKFAKSHVTSSSLHEKNETA